jgi:hypothetical protein
MALLTAVDFPSEPAAFVVTTVAAAAGGDKFENKGRTGFYVSNATGTSKTVTFAAQRACNHGVLHNSAVVVPDLFSGFIATEFENDRFNSSAGIVSVTYSAVGLQVAAVRLP